MAFRVRASEREAVLRGLDERESGGFQRTQIQFHFSADPRPPLQALAYVAPPGNPNFLGDAPLEAILEQVRAAHGRSGSNLDYVLRLAESLRGLAGEEDEIFRIADRLYEEA